SSPRDAADGDEVKALTLSAAHARQARGGSIGEAAPLWAGATPRGRVLTALGADLDGDKNEEVILGVWLNDGTGELLVMRASR
ncbi:MAG: hypothetical protein JNK82_31285, partial [Myxococcaceae bacterium]|nr:hypothetical protein [Myxococcaceae bacterium]